MSNSRETDKSFFREWLEKLQQESWQLELIISGFALYGIYSSKGALVELDIALLQFPRSIFLSFLALILSVGWRIFFFNLLLHVILRSVWIGAIGLRYVSGEINYDQLNYNERFNNYLNKKVGDYDDFIEKLEKLCSVLFSYTFLLFLFFVSVIAFTAFALIPFTIVDSSSANANLNSALGIGILIYFLLGLIVFIDFVSVGAIKRVKDPIISKLYMPIYKFFGIITLSFLYRPLLYNFLDNKYTKRLFFFSFPYIILIAFYADIFDSNAYPHFPNKELMLEEGLINQDCYYADLTEIRLSTLQDMDKREFISKHNHTILVSSYNMTEPYPYVYFKAYRSDTKLFEQLNDIEPIFKPGWRFSLWGSSLKTDSTALNIKESYEERIEAYRNQYKDLRNESRREKDEKMKEKLSIEMDSVVNLRRELTNEREEKLSNARKLKHANILDAYVSLIDIKVDGTDYKDSLTCKFHNHPMDGSKGFICHFPISSISPGMHQIEIDRTSYSENSPTKTEVKKFIFPFIKQF